MKPAPFVYERPRTVREAAVLLRERQDAKVLAGGQSLVPLLNMRLASPSILVDVNDVDEMKGIRLKDGRLRIGALTRHQELERDPVIRKGAPLLAEAARLIGHEAIRTRGTIGGSVAHADPAAELPLALHVLGATVHLVSEGGERSLAVEDFFQGLMLTAMEAEEVLVDITVPVKAPREGTAIREFARREGDFAVVAAAVRMRLGEDGDIVEARVSLGGVGPGPVRAHAMEAALLGLRDEASVLRRAALVREEIDPEDDVHASRAFRTHLASTLTEDAARSAFAAARQGRSEDR